MNKILLIFLLILISSVCYSQYSKLRINSSRDINFSTILPGVSESITETNSLAGKFVLYYSGKSSTDVSITFSLQKFLTYGTNNIPVTFTSTISTNSNDGVPGTPFNPYIGTTVTFNNSNKYYYARLGGTIYPPSTLQAGDYSSPIIITLTIVTN
jgi:hypothetical protein